MPPTRSWSPAGADEWDLAGLSAEMLARSQPGADQDGPDDGYNDRDVRLETTYDGAGVNGREPDRRNARRWSARCWTRCPSPMGAEDTRTHGPALP